VPTRHAALEDGETVLDLGSGAGNDAFIARHEVGAEGKVIGADMTPEMIAKARMNAAKLDYPFPLSAPKSPASSSGICQTLTMLALSDPSSPAGGPRSPRWVQTN
jgi:SAM-dependent methyltransferase